VAAGIHENAGETTCLTGHTTIAGGGNLDLYATKAVGGRCERQCCWTGMIMGVAKLVRRRILGWVGKSELVGRAKGK